MAFKPLDIQTLRAFAQNLKEEEFNYNADRLKAIQLIKILSTSKVDSANKMLTGICISLMEVISETYRSDPHPYEFFGYKIKGSKLYDKLEKGLGITPQNTLNDSDRLIYLIALYKYAETNPEKLLTDEQSKLLVSKLQMQIQKLYSRPVIQDQIKKILTQPFSANALTRRFQEIPGKYQKHIEEYEKSKWSIVSSISSFHKDHVKLIELFHSQDFLNLIENAIKSEECKNAEAKNQRRMWLRTDSMHFAIPLYIMSEIEAEYTRSPENSKLYVLCQQAINLQHTSQLPAILQNKYYSEFNAIVTNILLDANLMTKWIKAFNNPNYLLELKKKLVTKITKLTYPEEKGYFSYLTAGLTGIALYSAQSEIDLSINNATNRIYQKLGPTKFVLDYGIELIGYAVLGPKGAIIAGYLAPMIEKQLISFTLASVFYRLIVQASSLFEKTVGKACTITFAVTAEGAKSLAALCKRLYAEAEKNGHVVNYDEDFINALLDTPDVIFAADKKEILKDITEIDLQPGSNPAIDKSDKSVSYPKMDKAISINGNVSTNEGVPNNQSDDHEHIAGYFN